MKFTATAFKENTELSTLAQLQSALIARDKKIKDLEKLLQKRTKIIGGFTANNKKQNSV